MWGLYKISESVRAYAYLILSSQASARSGIVGNTASALTAQSVFLSNFENVVNRRVDISEDIKHYQNTLSYTSIKVDYSVGDNLYMLPSDMNLKVKEVLSGIIIKFLYPMVILVWGKMKMLTTPAIKSHKANSLDAQSAPQVEPTTIESHSNTAQGLGPGGTPLCRTHAPTISHEDEKTALILFLTGGFTVWFLFR